MDDLKVIGKRLEIAREAFGLSRRELGEMVGYSYSTIRRYETGELRLPWRMAPRFSQILGISVQDIYFGDPKGRGENESILKRCFRKIRGMGYKEFGEHKEGIMLNRTERAIRLIAILGLVASLFTAISGLPRYMYLLCYTVVYVVILLFALELRALFRQELEDAKKVRKVSNR